MKNRKIIICLLVGILLCSFYMVGIFIEKEETVVDAIVEDKLPIESNDVSKLIKVDIKGAVKKPGVYEVYESARIIDIIELAGGLKSKANTEYINLSKIVEDEMVIWIYTNDEIKEFKKSNIKYEYIDKTCKCPDVSTSACINNSNVNDKININTATLEELMTLPGIGESKALSIIEYREKTLFKTLEDIKNVSGIGDSAFDRIKDYITV